MRIDIDNVLRERAPRYHRYIPRWMVRWLERTICQDRLNYILEHNYPATGADFADGALNDMGVTYDLAGQLPDPSRRRVILVSNHPLGGLDGLVLASAARRIYGGSAEDVKFVVNDHTSSISLSRCALYSSESTSMAHSRGRGPTASTRRLPVMSLS